MVKYLTSDQLFRVEKIFQPYFEIFRTHMIHNLTSNLFLVKYGQISDICLRAGKKGQMSMVHPRKSGFCPEKTGFFQKKTGVVPENFRSHSGKKPVFFRNDSGNFPERLRFFSGKNRFFPDKNLIFGGAP